jgi:hypothetical protein
MSKYYIAQIDERHGEHKTSTTILVRAKDSDQAWDRLDRIAQTWRGKHEGVWDDYTYWFDGTLASAGHYEEIPYQTFKLLDEDTFLNDLTTKGRL